MSEKIWRCNICNNEQPVSAGNICKRCGYDLLLYGKVLYPDGEVPGENDPGAQQNDRNEQNGNGQGQGQNGQETNGQGQGQNGQDTSGQNGQNGQGQHIPGGSTQGREHPTPKKKSKAGLVAAIVTAVVLLLIAAAVAGVLLARGMIGGGSRLPEPGSSGPGTSEPNDDTQETDKAPEETTKKPADSKKPAETEKKPAETEKKPVETEPKYTVTDVDVHIDNTMYMYDERVGELVAVMVEGEAMNCSIIYYTDTDADVDPPATLECDNTDVLKIVGNEVTPLGPAPDGVLVKLTANVGGCEGHLYVYVIGLIDEYRDLVDKSEDIPRDAYDHTIRVYIDNFDERPGNTLYCLTADGVIHKIGDEVHDNVFEVHFDIDREKAGTSDIAAILLSLRDLDGNDYLCTVHEVTAYCFVYFEE